MDEKLTKKRALALWDTNKIDQFEVGTVIGLQDIQVTVEIFL